MSFSYSYVYPKDSGAQLENRVSRIEQRIEKRLDRIEEKLDKLIEKNAAIESSSSIQTPRRAR